MLNPDMSLICWQSPGSMTWQSSPSGTVERKRFHLVGLAESGQVTSLVRYLPGATFPSHEHPEGEEILVLEGVFSDEQGDWPAGTHLLNPEGFSHSPFSLEGCLLFVKLRQYTGADHQVNQVAVNSAKEVSEQILNITESQVTSVLQVPRGENWQRHCEGGAEAFIISGECEINQHLLVQYDWIRLPSDSTLTLSTVADTRVYLKTGAVRHLRSSKDLQ